MLRIALATLFLAPSLAFSAPAKVGIDTSGSKIQWRGSKMMGESHTGTVNVKTGSFLNVEGEKITSGEIIIDMTSIKNEDVKDSGYNAKLVGHLKSSDFFDVEKNNEAKFVIKKVTPQPENRQLFEGDLTIRGTTQPGKVLANVAKDKGVWVATGKMDFDRTKFNVKYNSKGAFPNLVSTGKDKIINDQIDLEYTIKTVTK